MRETLVNLLKVKSIVTILLTLTFAFLALTKVISEEQFMSIFTVVIAFYFGTQFNKNSKEEDIE